MWAPVENICTQDLNLVQKLHVVTFGHEHFVTFGRALTTLQGSPQAFEIGFGS